MTVEDGAWINPKNYGETAWIPEKNHENPAKLLGLFFCMGIQASEKNFFAKFLWSPLFHWSPGAFPTSTRRFRTSDFPSLMRSGDQIPATAILPRRTAHDPLEGGAEGALGFVAERL